MRIASFLPAATEMACALGLHDNMVGISFECDYPAGVTRHPRLVRSAIDTHLMTPQEIDAAVSEHMKQGKSLYLIDEEKLKSVRPDLILTQDLCQVCAPSGNELSQALAALDYKPQVISMSPNSLADIQANLLELAAFTGKTQEAKALIAHWQARIERVRNRALAQFPRVFVMEWVEPIYCAGHWLAEMIEIAGGNDSLARKGADSVRLQWSDVMQWQPEVLVVAPCGYDAPKALEQIALLEKLPGWDSLPAVRNGRVHAVDAHSFFARPGPRTIDGIELLADLFHMPLSRSA